MTAFFDACVTVHPPHFVRDDKHWVNLDNGSEVDIELERTGTRGPGRISLPAMTTTLIRLDGPRAELAAGLGYRVTNFLVGPERPLEVKLVIAADK